MVKIIAIIPARSGSKGIKNKNIKKLFGHTLLEWSISAAKQSKLIDKVLVSTDSKRYANIASKFGAEVPFLRPRKISQDNSSDFDFILHAINELKKLKVYPEYFIHLRPTTPLRDPKIIDRAIKFFKKNKNYDSLRSVHLMSESSYKTMEIKNGSLKSLSLLSMKNLDSNSYRQSFPNTYQANGYVDILSIKYIQKFHEIHGNKILPFITKTTHEIDNLDDYKYLEYLVSKSPDIVNRLFK